MALDESCCAPPQWRWRCSPGGRHAPPRCCCCGRLTTRTRTHAHTQAHAQAHAPRQASRLARQRLAPPDLDEGGPEPLGQARTVGRHGHEVLRRASGGFGVQGFRMLGFRVSGGEGHGHEVLRAVHSKGGCQGLGWVGFGGEGGMAPEVVHADRLRTTANTAPRDKGSRNQGLGVWGFRARP